MHYTTPEVYEFISTQTNDPIIERKICRISWTKFAIFQSDLDFYKKVSPKFWNKLYLIPTPTLCPEERQRRRLMFRNERKLYRRKCDASEKSIISIYSPDKPYKVYDQKIRRSDNRDAMSYGKTFDFNKTVTEQFNSLDKAVPKMNVFQENNENCKYNNRLTNSKNCYLTVDSWNCEDTYYSTTLWYSNNCIDIIWGDKNENCFSCINIRNCNNCFYSTDTTNCYNLFKCQNCNWCSNCINCSNLTNKEYYINNKKTSKEDFFRNKKNIKENKNINNFYQNILKINSENIYWNDIYNSTNTIFCFWAFDEKNTKYCYTTWRLENSYDCYETWIESTLLNDVHACMYTTKSSYINNWIRISNSLYLSECFDCKNCFACSWLRNKQYCIFNKQYTKEEYNELVPKIIKHMQSTWERWKFFDSSLSPFGYNETVAQEYFPLSEIDAKQKWYKRQEKNYDPVIPEWADTIAWDQIPTDTTSVNDDILRKIFVCEISWRPFKIIKQELDFYHKHNLPLPRKHPDIRHEERLKQRPARELHLRNCDKCNKEIISVYDKNHKWQIYCEACYQKEVYS